MLNLLVSKQKTSKLKGTIIDVREIFEYYSTHIPGATNIPLDTIPYKIDVIKALPKPILLYCTSGKRSALGVNYLRSMGVSEVYDGGKMDELKEKICQY